MPSMLGDNEVLRAVVHGPLTELLVRLNGHDGEKWLQALKRFVRKELPYENPAFSAWKRINIGTIESIPKLATELMNSGTQPYDERDDFFSMLARMPLVPKKERITLAYLEFKDFGFREQFVPRAKLYRRALQLGFQYCPAEVGPLLCLQRQKHAKGYWAEVVMDPIVAQYGKAGIFEVGNSNGTFILRIKEADPEISVHANSSDFVFALP